MARLPLAVAQPRHAAIATLHKRLIPDRAGRMPAIFITSTMNHSNPNISSGFAAAPRDLTDYEKAREDQSGRLTVLEDLVASLEQRLAPVLNPDLSRAAEATGKSEVERAPAQLIGAMRHHTSRIEVVTDRLTELRDRLCL